MGLKNRKGLINGMGMEIVIALADWTELPKLFIRKRLDGAVHSGLNS